MAGTAARPLWLDLMKFTPCTPFELERLKLDRLRELRATIDSLRHEHQARDPLMAWVMEQERTGRTGNP
jgi:hypothetical protein